MLPSKNLVYKIELIVRLKQAVLRQEWTIACRNRYKLFTKVVQFGSEIEEIFAENDDTNLKK